VTVDTFTPANGVATRPTTPSDIAHQSADVMAYWASAASDAARFVAPLVRTDFMPAHFRPKGDSQEAMDLAIASGTAAVVFGLGVGLNPLQALQGVYVIQGRPAMYAGTMVGLVQSKGHEIWVKELTDSRAVVCGRRKGSEHTEQATFTIQRAQQAGYVAKNGKYRTDPQAMLLARAQSDCCKRVARDVLMGLSSVEEMWDEEGNGEPAASGRTMQRSSARKAPAAVVTPEPEPTPEPERPAARRTQKRARPVEDRPLPEVPAEGELDEYDAAMTEAAGNLASQEQLTKLSICLNELGITEVDARGRYIRSVIGRDVASRKELTADEASQVIESLGADLDARDFSDDVPPVQDPPPTTP
jgi:hypothetical protein